MRSTVYLCSKYKSSDNNPQCHCLYYKSTTSQKQ